MLCEIMPSYRKIDIADNITLLLKLCSLLNVIKFLKSVWELPNAYQYIENTIVEIKLGEKVKGVGGILNPIKRITPLDWNFIIIF